MPDYVDVIHKCFPEAEIVVRNNADHTVYGNIEWISTPIPQATLDASECAINPVEYNVNDVSFQDAFGQVLEAHFSKTSVAANVWLTNNSLPSNANPAIIPFNGKLVGVAFNNGTLNVDTDIEIYVTDKNSNTAELVYTWEFRNGRQGFNNQVTQAVFRSGSKISVYLRKVSNSKPSDVTMTVYLQVIDANPETHVE